MSTASIDLFGGATAPRGGMGVHQSVRSETEVWLTPPFILDALGPFDLDPAAAPTPRPWRTAATHYARTDNGLARAWHGRVWLNPPYGGPTVIGPWLRRLAAHGRGAALLFARTETEAFHASVWDCATALLFLRGRLHFHHPDGRRAEHNAGAPSVLVAYGDRDALRLSESGLAGAFVRLRP